VEDKCLRKCAISDSSATVGEFHLGRCEMRTDEFRPSHGELGRWSVRCVWAGSAWATVSCMWASSTLAEMSLGSRGKHGMSAGSLRPGRPPRDPGWSVRSASVIFLDCSDERIRGTFVVKSRPTNRNVRVDGCPFSRITAKKDHVHADKGHNWGYFPN
jgi:hypothetical protein